MMIELRWKGGGNSATAVVSVTELRLERRRDVPALLLRSVALRRAALRSRGVVGAALAADLRRRTFWTLSAWMDDDALRSFVRSPSHTGAMRTFRGRLAHTKSSRWRSETPAAPTWDAVRRHLDETAPAPGVALTSSARRRAGGCPPMPPAGC